MTSVGSGRIYFGRVPSATSSPAAVVARHMRHTWLRQTVRPENAMSRSIGALSPVDIRHREKVNVENVEPPVAVVCDKVQRSQLTRA